MRNSRWPTFRTILFRQRIGNDIGLGIVGANKTKRTFVLAKLMTLPHIARSKLAGGHLLHT